MMFLGFLFGLCTVGVSAFEAHIGLTTAPYGVEFSLRNTENQSVTILILGTPLEPSCKDDVANVLCADMFNIVSELNVTAVYTGIVSKRMFSASAFKTLRPNQTVTAQVNLSHGYWFPQPGTYRVSLKASIALYRGRSTNLSLFTRMALPSNETLLLPVLLTAPFPEYLRPQNNTIEKIAGFVGCSANQTAYLQAMEPDTLQNALQAYNYLASGNCSNRPDYVKWFGACTDANYNYVTQNMLNIVNRIQAGTYTIQCNLNCGSWTIAWVYTTIPKIHLCPLFWEYPREPCNLDSQVGTIVHEVSHWVDVAGTDDYCYGESECTQMAIQSPYKATHNADSYCMFASSCPISPPGVPVATTVTFASFPTDSKGVLGTTAAKRSFTLTCKHGGQDCRSVRVQSAVFDSDSFSFAPSSTGVPSTKMVAQSTVTLALSATQTTNVPVYLYASNWPMGTYTFKKNSGVSVVSGNGAIITKNALKVTGAWWSGILKFPGGSRSVSWRGTPKEKKAQLVFTLAWVNKPQ